MKCGLRSGIEAVVIDYIRPCLFGGKTLIPNLAQAGVWVLSAFTLGALYYFRDRFYESLFRQKIFRPNFGQISVLKENLKIYSTTIMNNILGFPAVLKPHKGIVLSLI
jgi:hypothetical protein